MRLSPVELAERSASYRAVGHAIAHQFRDKYDTSQPLPGQLVGLLQRLERDDQPSPKSALVAPIEDAVTKRRHLVELVGDAAEKRSRMASLLSQLSARKAALARAIEDACEMQERCRLTRQMRRSGIELSWA